MNYIGYINKAQYFEHTKEIINLMKGHGCVNIHIEETKDKKRIEGVSSLTVFQMETVRCLRHSTMCFTISTI